MIAVYTAQNPYLTAIGVKEGSEVEVGYFDQSEYKSCGQAVVGQEFIKNLADCVGTSSTAFQTSTWASYSADDCAVFAFAAIGMAALAQQAYKMVVKKNHETMPIYSEV
jgi:hypothetical protein